MQVEKLIRMANQIAANLAARPDAVALCAGHISDYWDPRMRAALIALVEAGDPGLHPLVAQASPLIRRPTVSVAEGTAICGSGSVAPAAGIDPTTN